jgi:hypothetical protein
MSSNVTKRALSAGLGVGALALLAPRASADTPFSSFAFRATGAPTARTLPDRLGELKTVKDFGAKGDGVTDDAPAFQAAADAVTNVFIPKAIYNIATPVMIRHDWGMVNFRGDGCTLSWGGGAGFMFHRTSGGDGAFLKFEGIFFRNTNAWDTNSGCVRMGGLAKLFFHECDFESRQCIKTYRDTDVNGWGVRWLDIQNCNFNGWAPDQSVEQPWGLESVGILCQGVQSAMIRNCYWNGFGRCVQVGSASDGGLAAYIVNCFGEMVSIGIDVPFGSVTLDNVAFEAAYECGFDLRGANPCHARNLYLLNDGWENHNTGGKDGIRFGTGQYYLTGVGVDGQRTGGALVFNGSPTKSVFMGVTPSVSGGGVAWKGFTASPGLTLIQCNNP